MSHQLECLVGHDDAGVVVGEEVEVGFATQVILEVAIAGIIHAVSFTVWLTGNKVHERRTGFVVKRSLKQYRPDTKICQVLIYVAKSC